MGPNTPNTSNALVADTLNYTYATHDDDHSVQNGWSRLGMFGLACRCILISRFYRSLSVAPLPAHHNHIYPPSQTSLERKSCTLKMLAASIWIGTYCPTECCDPFAHLFYLRQFC